MKRPAYKSKWLAAEATAQHEKWRADIATTELERLLRVLGEAGESVLERAIESKDNTYDLNPVDNECAKSFIQLTQRIVYPHDGYSQLYTWRGLPLRVMEK